MYVMVRHPFAKEHWRTNKPIIGNKKVSAMRDQPLSDITIAPIESNEWLKGYVPRVVAKHFIHDFGPGAERALRADNEQLHRVVANQQMQGKSDGRFPSAGN